MKYLVVECVTLYNQYECDADRTPICMVDEWKDTKYDAEGYEIYEVQPNGFLERIRRYTEIHEDGFALVFYDGGDDEFLFPTVIKKWKDMSFDDAEKELITNLKEYFPFEDYTDEEVLYYFRGSNEWSEQVGDKWYVFGPYWDNHYPTGV